MGQQSLENKKLYWVFVGELTAEGQQCSNAGGRTSRQSHVAGDSSRAQSSIRWQFRVVLCYLCQSAPGQTDRKAQTGRCSHRVFGKPQGDIACCCCQERLFLQRGDVLMLYDGAGALALSPSRSWFKIGICRMRLMQVMCKWPLSLGKLKSQRNITPAYRWNCKPATKERK